MKPNMRKRFIPIIFKEFVLKIATCGIGVLISVIIEVKNCYTSTNTNVVIVMMIMVNTPFYSYFFKSTLSGSITDSQDTQD